MTATPPVHPAPTPCPWCGGAVALQECDDCGGTGQGVGLDVLDRVWSLPCPWCGGAGRYPVCAACGWGEEE